jgi:hypothetical protein
MTFFSLYDASTGIFTSASVSVPLSDLDANIPTGYGCIMGHYDALTQRVDIASGLVVDYQPPQPSPDHVWDIVKKCWSYVPTLADCKTAKQASINTHSAWLLSQVTSGYPDEEIQSWSKQEGEARAYSLDALAPIPLLTALASARGIAVTDLVARVIAKSDGFALVSGAHIGTRQRCEDQIKAAQTIEQVNAITWEG